MVTKIILRHSKFGEQSLLLDDLDSAMKALQVAKNRIE